MVHTVIRVYCCCIFICFYQFILFSLLFLFFVLLMYKNAPKYEFVNILFEKMQIKKQVKRHRHCQFSTLDSAIL